MRSFVSLLALVVLAAGCASLASHNANQDPGPGQVEAILMQRAEKEQALMDGSGILYEDPMLLAYLEQVVARLQAASGAPWIAFRVRVIDDPHLNAFAFVNGVIYVHTGILARLNNEAQLAALLAHEMIHCIHRHALKAARKFGVSAQTSVLPEISLLGPGQAEDLFSRLDAFQSMALVAAYTQKLETEADMGAIRVMSQAGYDPDEALRLLEHLRREAQEEGIREPFLFATHPGLEKRMENMRRFLYNLPRNRGKGIRSESLFQEKIGGLLLHNASLDLKAGRYDIAQRGVRKFLANHGPDGKAYFLLGEIFRQRGGPGDNPRAKATYKRAIFFDASYSDPHKALGLIYFKEGEWALAKASFESCLALSPDRPDRPYIEDYLERCTMASRARERHAGNFSGTERGS